MCEPLCEVGTRCAPRLRVHVQVRKASAQAVLGEPLSRDPWLLELRVACLSAQQVVAVVERRL